MGLDVSYYSKATFLREGGPDDDAVDWGNGEFWAYPNSEFPKQAEGLQTGIYKAETVGSIAAGAYSRYNRWRDQLAALAGYGSAEAAWKMDDDGRDSGPFWELINFSDCEGMIGAQTSAKLAQDFADHQAKADAHPDEYFRDRYRVWRKAFETAADSGMVVFH